MDVCAAARNATARGEKTPELSRRADGRPACGCEDSFCGLSGTDNFLAAAYVKPIVTISLLTSSKQIQNMAGWLVVVIRRTWRLS